MGIKWADLIDKDVPVIHKSEKHTSGCRVKSLPKNRYGFLTVLSYSHVGKNKQACWNVLCDCGTQKVVRGSSLKSGDVKACGCLLARHRGPYIKNIIGYKVGGLTVESMSGEDCVCRCVCGGSIVMSRKKIIKGDNKYCGCRSKRKSRNEI